MKAREVRRAFWTASRGRAPDRAYTALGAYLNFEEDKKGTLEVGKFADMVLLSEDLLSIDPKRIMEVDVEKTWIGGSLVYDRDSP